MKVDYGSRDYTATSFCDPVQRQHEQHASSHSDAAGKTDASSLPRPFALDPANKKNQELEQLALLFSQNKIDIDSLLPKLLSLLCKHHTDWMKIQKQLIVSEDRWSEIQDAKQLQLQERVIDEQQTVQTCNKVQKGVAAGGFALSAFSALFASAIPIPLAVAGIGYGLFLTIDTFCDDFVKKQVAGFIAQGDKESESTWLSRIELFTNLSSFALSFGFNPTGAVNIAMQVAKITVGVVKGTLDDRLKQLQADLHEVNFTCEQSDARKDEFRQELLSMMSDVHYFYEMYKKALNNQNQTAKVILR